MTNLYTGQLAPLSAEEADRVCADVIEKLEAFEAILAQETAHVAAARLTESFALTEKKAEAAGAYLQSVEDMKRQMVPLKKLAPKTLLRLKERHEALKSAVEHNMRTLATVKAVSEKLLRDVTADALKSRTLDTYGSSAQMTRVSRETMTTPLHLSKKL
ncbi:MAG: hypothetical protein ACKOC1_03035 [Hyphomicrobiales bacterium]